MRQKWHLYAEAVASEWERLLGAATGMVQPRLALVALVLVANSRSRCSKVIRCP
jgi:hypothetical protein